MNSPGILFDKEALERNFKSSVSWLDSNLDFFSPWTASGLSMDGLQATAELAVLWSNITTTQKTSGLAGDNVDITMQRWRSHLYDVVSKPEVVELPMKRPVQAFPYLLPYLVLRPHGYRNDFIETSISRLYSIGFPNNQEIVPYRALDVAYFLRKAQLKFPEEPETLAKSTFLFKAAGRLYVDHDLAYAITHTIFYLTDFGFIRSRIIEDNILRVSSVLLSLIVHHVRSGHFDILGELLACWCFCGLQKNRIVETALRFFLAQHVHGGAIAGRREVKTDLLNQQNVTTREQLFGTCYHTTIVSLLVTTHLLRGNH